MATWHVYVLRGIPTPVEKGLLETSWSKSYLLCFGGDAWLASCYTRHNSPNPSSRTRLETVMPDIATPAPIGPATGVEPPPTLQPQLDSWGNPKNTFWMGCQNVVQNMSFKLDFALIDLICV